MTDDFFQRVAKDLPNFPMPVIKQWLEHAAGDGWPPRHDKFGEPLGRWRNVLAQRGVVFWRTVTWAPEARALRLSELDYESELTVRKIRRAFENGLPHAPDLPVAGASDRVRTFIGIVTKTGRLPVPPVLLRKRCGVLEALDGFHRLAALFPSSQRRDEPTAAPHDFWVASGGADPIDW